MNVVFSSGVDSKAPDPAEFGRFGRIRFSKYDRIQFLNIFGYGSGFQKMVDCGSGFQNKFGSGLFGSGSVFKIRSDPLFKIWSNPDANPGYNSWSEPDPVLK